MLGSVGKWLRAAGYDTKIIRARQEDEEIFAQAIHENRFLLTRDKKMRLDAHVIILSANSIRECIQELNCRLSINWLLHPFSRCLMCNSLLITPDNPSLMQDVPPNIRAAQAKLWYCTECRKTYWEGSHTQRMFKKLQEWQEL
jgi:uncharacterized protein with PIN domain